MIAVIRIRIIAPPADCKISFFKGYFILSPEIIKHGSINKVWLKLIFLEILIFGAYPEENYNISVFIEISNARISKFKGHN